MLDTASRVLYFHQGPMQAADIEEALRVVRNVEPGAGAH